MKRIVYTCDRCRKEITGNPHRMFIECVDRETGDFQQETVHPEVGQLDICKECTDFLAGLVMKHVKKGAPAVVNEDFEKAVEDMVATSQQDKPDEKAKYGRRLDTGKIRALRNAGWTVKNIAIEMSCSETAIYNALKKMEMPEKGKAPGTEVHEGNQQSSKL